jgi:hypothetical protein
MEKKKKKKAQIKPASPEIGAGSSQTHSSPAGLRD